MSDVTYAVYKKVSGDGPEYRCDVRDRGQSTLFFAGQTAEEAETKAREYANRVFNTPERLQRIAEIAAARAKARAKKAPKGADND